MGAGDTTVEMEVFSDIACPWCFIGRRRLEAAARRAPAIGLRMRHRAFELSPELPVDGVEARSFFLAKFGSERQMLRIFRHVDELARVEGLAFDSEKMRIAPNTRLAHRVIFTAREYGAEAQALEALYRGMFEEGVNVGRIDEILLLLKRHRVPVPLPELEEALAMGSGLDQLAKDRAEAKALHIDSVPSFIVAGRIVGAGAETVDGFRAILSSLPSVDRMS